MSRIRHLAVLLFVALSFQAVTPAPAAAQDEPLQWKTNWERATWVDGALATGLFAAGAGIQFGIGAPADPNWKGPIFADRFFRSTFLADAETDQLNAGMWSDVLLVSLIGAPLAIQPGMAWLGHDSPTVASQALIMNAEALAMTFFATTAIKHAVGRERPPIGECWDDPLANPFCSERSTLSFPSGHTSMAFAGAGLVCLNHEKLGLFENEVWGQVACYTALAGAATTGFLRITSNNHYFSDIAAGAALGLTTGYLIPKWLYFGFGSGAGTDELEQKDARLTPQVGPNFKGVSFGMSF